MPCRPQHSIPMIRDAAERKANESISATIARCAVRERHYTLCNYHCVDGDRWAASSMINDGALSRKSASAGGVCFGAQKPTEMISIFTTAGAIII